MFFLCVNYGYIFLLLFQDNAVHDLSCLSLILAPLTDFGLTINSDRFSVDHDQFYD